MQIEDPTSNGMSFDDASEETLADLKKLNRRLCYEGRYWGRDGALSVSRQISKTLMKLGNPKDALSGLGSAHYSAAGAALGKARTCGGLASLIWTLRSFWQLFLARLCSDRMMEGITPEQLTPSQLDIRAAILKKTGELGGAEECLRIGVEKIKKVIPHDDSLVLLRASYAELLDESRKHLMAESLYMEAAHFLGDVSKEARIRFQRSRARHFIAIGDTEKARVNLESALRTAREQGITDQANKIMGELKDL